MLLLLLLMLGDEGAVIGQAHATSAGQAVRARGGRQPRPELWSSAPPPTPSPPSATPIQHHHPATLRPEIFHPSSAAASAPRRRLRNHEPLPASLGPAQRRRLRRLRPLLPPDRRPHPAHPTTYRDGHQRCGCQVQGRRRHCCRQPSIIWLPRALHGRQAPARLQQQIGHRLRRRRVGHAIPGPPPDVSLHQGGLQPARSRRGRRAGGGAAASRRRLAERQEPAHLPVQGAVQAPVRLQPAVERAADRRLRPRRHDAVPGPRRPAGHHLQRPRPGHRLRRPPGHPHPAQARPRRAGQPQPEQGGCGEACQGLHEGALLPRRPQLGPLLHRRHRAWPRRRPQGGREAGEPELAVRREDSGLWHTGQLEINHLCVWRLRGLGMLSVEVLHTTIWLGGYFSLNGGSMLEVREAGSVHGRNEG